MLPVPVHPHVEKLELYSLQMLDRLEEERVEVHLLLCGRCLQKTQDLEQQITLMRLALSE